MKTLVIGEGTVSDLIRSGMFANNQHRNNGDVTLINLSNTPWQKIQEEYSKPYDLIIYSRPSAPELIEWFKNFSDVILVDIDDDFWSIPKTHIGYNWVGPGNPMYLEGVETCLKMANGVVVSTPVMEDIVSKITDKPITVIPNGWDSFLHPWDIDNVLTDRSKKTIFWGGTATHKDDFKLCSDAIQEVVNSISHTRVIIMGDYDNYNLLKAVDHTKKMFIPMIQYREYVHLLGVADVFLAPLLDTKFNRAKSDIKLVDAMARRVKYVASPVKAYLDFHNDKCGYIANNKTEWIDYIVKAFSESSSYRKTKRVPQIMERESSVLAKLWLDFYQQIKK